jgi:CRP-like cAMP-binding protein
MQKLIDYIEQFVKLDPETIKGLKDLAEIETYKKNEFIQACENTEVISITKSNSEKLAQFPKIMTFVNAMMGKEFASIDKHTKELNQRDAKGKYEYLREIAPELIKRAKIGHIASIIGVSRETLSRIRKV